MKRHAPIHWIGAFASSCPQLFICGFEFFELELHDDETEDHRGGEMKRVLPEPENDSGNGQVEAREAEDDQDRPCSKGSSTPGSGEKQEEETVKGQLDQNFRDRRKQLIQLTAP